MAGNDRGRMRGEGQPRGAESARENEDMPDVARKALSLSAVNILPCGCLP